MCTNKQRIKQPENGNEVNHLVSSYQALTSICILHKKYRGIYESFITSLLSCAHENALRARATQPSLISHKLLKMRAVSVVLRSSARNSSKFNGAALVTRLIAQKVVLVSY